MTTNVPPRIGYVQNSVLTQLTLLIEQHLINVIPNKVLYKIVWDVALLNGGISFRYCHYELNRHIVSILTDEIYYDSLVPLLTTRNVKIPYWMSPMDLYEILEQHVNIYTIKGVTTLYKSLDDCFSHR